MERPRIGIVGLGSMGSRYLKYFSSLNGIDVLAYDPKKLKDDRGYEYEVEENPKVTFLESYSDLLDMNNTVLVIASPAGTHMELLKQAREINPTVSVLVEKPLSDKPISGEDVTWCLMQRGLISVGYNWRFHDYAKHLVMVKPFIRDITLSSSQDMRQWPGEDYCDPIREFSHEFDMLRYLTTDPVFTKVGYSTSGRYIVEGIHQNGNWRVRIDPYHNPIRKWIRLTMIDGSVIKYSWDRSRDAIERMYRNQARELLEATVNNDDVDSLTCSLNDGLRTTLLVDEIVEHMAKEEVGKGTVM
jgi:predicted dehydrogenase